MAIHTEDGFTTSYMTNEKGEKYRFNTYITDSYKDEGSPIPESCYRPTAELALDALDELIERISNGYSFLYFRQTPKAEYNESNQQWYARARLILSHEPLTGDREVKVKDIRQLGWRSKKGPQAGNASGFRATGHRILLLPDAVEEKSAGGIVLVSKTQKAEQDHAVIATVIEIGFDAWTDKSTDYCDVGDRVLIGQYTGKFHESPVDGKLYRFVQDLDIISPVG